MRDALADEKPRSRRMMALLALIGLLVGLPAGWATGKLMKAARMDSVPWSDVGALLLALMFLFGGFLVAALSLGRRGQAVLASPRRPEFGRAVGRSQITYFRLQAGVLILAGLLLAIPLAFELLARDGAATSGVQVMVAVLAGFGLQTALNISLWRRSDEVYRRSMADSGAVCFWLLQGLLFLWASGEKLKLLPTISSWDALTVLMGVYLATSSIVTYRRGLD